MGGATFPVSLLLQAFLSRAVQQLAQACQQQGIPEAAVAKKLRTRGVDLAQLQDRAEEVQRGVEECASDEGWTLIQVII
jgi:intracellular sulfur oxidation DsrE/DsrF family protein